MDGVERPSLRAILSVFFRLGMASFGGGLPKWMHHEVVRKRAWLDEERFMAGLSIGQVLPGPNSVNLARYMGQQLRGWPGAAAAFLGILGPPFLFILVLAVAQARFSGSATMAAARRVRSVGLWGVAAATFVAVGVLRLPMIPVVLVPAPPVGVGIALEAREGGG